MKELPWLLLLASVCFKIFFLVGAARARRAFKQLRTPEGRARFVGGRIGLDESQIRAMDVILTRRRAALDNLTHDWAPEIEQFWELAAREDADPARTRAAIEKLTELWKQGAVIRTRLLGEMLRLMTREQRRAFIRLIRKRNDERV